MTSASIHPYAAGDYARALADGTGAALEVMDWGSFVLTREISPRDTRGLPGLRDAMGVYPMTPIREQADLKDGLGRLADQGLVSVVLVPDPLASPEVNRLTAAFGLCRPFKIHYLVDRAAGDYAPSKHHRAEIRRAQRRCRVELVRLTDHLPAWTQLYDGLVERHTITGVTAFREAYFTALSREPRMTALAAYVGNEISAMTIWFEHAGVAYNHLGASNALGYANGANYALYDAAIAHFSQAAILNLGGGAGSRDDPSDGLAVFKRGFANAEVHAMLCGAVLDEARYAALAGGLPPTGYFPSYRG
ncbi:MAG: hypothetical protein JWP28_3978 [Phenylobacterium sp.]|uniref:hypothetical protein n=1 Tax=Phenylobacterium sp. TaxID=1871053 RepID=UPI0026271534|nr:hypothetical protein [Phenylobacterium sp.]MDB5499947.1 hypothetical protein [Phenylobacterium sp.]